MTEKPEYLLIKRGLYYRPDSCGYTGIKVEAGRYPASMASPGHGVTAIHETEAPEYAPATYDDIKVRHLADRVEALQAQVRALGHEPVQ